MRGKSGEGRDCYVRMPFEVLYVYCPETRPRLHSFTPFTNGSCPERDGSMLLHSSSIS